MTVVLGYLSNWLAHERRWSLHFYFMLRLVARLLNNPLSVEELSHFKAESGLVNGRAPVRADGQYILM